MPTSPRNTPAVIAEPLISTQSTQTEIESEQHGPRVTDRAKYAVALAGFTGAERSPIGGTEKGLHDDTIRTIIRDTISQEFPEISEEAVSQVAPNIVKQTASEVVPGLTKETAQQVVPEIVKEEAAKLVPEATRNEAEEIVPKMVEEKMARVAPVPAPAVISVPHTVVHPADLQQKYVQPEVKEPLQPAKESEKVASELLAETIPAHRASSGVAFASRPAEPRLEMHRIALPEHRTRAEAEGDSLVGGIRRSDDVSSSPEEAPQARNHHSHHRVVATAFPVAVPGPGELAPDVFMESSKGSKLPYTTFEAPLGSEIAVQHENIRAGSVQETETPPEAETFPQRPLSSMPSEHGSTGNGSQLELTGVVSTQQGESGIVPSIYRQAAETVEVPQTPDIAAISTAEVVPKAVPVELPATYAANPAAAVPAEPQTPTMAGGNSSHQQKKKKRGPIRGPLHKMAKEIKKVVHPS